jgi:hypothetical protein
MLEAHEHLREHLSLVLAGSHRFAYVNKRLACICIHILKLELDAVTETRARSVSFAHVSQLVSLASSLPIHMPCTSMVTDGSFSQGVIWLQPYVDHSQTCCAEPGAYLHDHSGGVINVREDIVHLL